ncbi:MAG: hypothetical protein GY710_12590 [Desulfobacteraceae bacterium]|nr:hypothetical protein [Desulfobacteraceae bacterium]
MNWLLPAVISALCFSFMLTGLYCSMYLQYRERYFGVWALGWALYFFRFAVLIATIKGIGNLLFLDFIVKVSAFIVGYIILRGIYIFISKPMPGWMHIGYAAGIIWLAYGVFAHIPFIYLTLPLYVFFGVSLIWGGWIVLQMQVSYVAGRNVLGCFLMLWGLHKIDYPFLRSSQWFAPWGFMIASLLAMGVALGMLLVYFQSLISELETAHKDIKKIGGLIPICSHCKKIRDDKGYWNILESYIQEHSEASFSHSMCPECSDEFYGEEDWYIKMKDKKEIK